MSDDDPYEALHGETAYGHAIVEATQSTEAQYIRSLIVSYMREVAEDDDGTSEFVKGYRMALRVAYQVAGGVVDGSEAQWAKVEGTGGG